MSAPLLLAGTSRRLPDALAEIGAIVRQWYPDLVLELVGHHPSGDPARDLHLPCPAAPGLAASPAVEPGLDGLVGAVTSLTRALFPRGEWVGVTVHQEGVPDALIPITLR